MEYILTFGSAHKALKAESVLKGFKIPFRLLPVPKALDPHCGLVISLKVEDFNAAAGTLSLKGLNPKTVYRKEGEEYVKV